MIPRSPALQMWEEVLSDLEMTPVREPLSIPEHEPEWILGSSEERHAVGGPYRRRFESLVEEIDPSMVFSGPLSGFKETKELNVGISKESFAALFAALRDKELEFDETPMRHVGKARLRFDVVYDAECNPYLSFRISSENGTTRTIVRVERKATPEESLSSLPVRDGDTLYMVSISPDPKRHAIKGKKRQGETQDSLAIARMLKSLLLPDKGVVRMAKVAGSGAECRSLA